MTINQNQKNTLIPAIYDAFSDNANIDQLAHINIQSGSIEEIWNTISRLLQVSPLELSQRLADKAGLQFREHLTVNTVIESFPRALIENFDVLPIESSNTELVLATYLIPDEELISRVSFSTNQHVRFVITTPTEFIYTRQLAFNARDLLSTSHALDLDTDTGDRNTLVTLTKHLLKQSINKNASDLHIQAFLGGGIVRIRVDGLLRRLTLLPDNVYSSICRLFKANGNMDPSNDRIPQDGRLTLRYQGKDIETRLSTLPTKGGERLVVRFLSKDQNFHLENNGFATKEMQSLRRLANSASGLFLITGPTGSGKTSTLYALLSELNSTEKNILTVENPVEYQLPGLSQVDINEKSGLSFAAALRSALRQDPDIVLVGEIRDTETAQIAIQAALTGHLVFSTLHTNDALSSIPRLLDLGIDKTTLADALIGLTAQRLCRQLCENCRQPTDKKLTPQEEAFHKITRIQPPFRAIGCEHCDYTGYKGRLPVIEIFPVDNKIRHHILLGQKPEPEDLTSDPNSLTTLSTSVTRHIISGDTTVGEALRTLGHTFWRHLMHAYTVEFFDVPVLNTESSEQALPGVLVLGSDDATNIQIRKLLEQNFFKCYLSKDAADAKQTLKEHSDIVMVIVDTQDEADEIILNHISKIRQHLAWSRLPALMLLPGDRYELPEKLINDGATSPYLFKPVNDRELLQSINSSLSFNIDLENIEI